MSTQRAFDFIPPSTVGDALPFPIARRSDPETSKEAAKEITESGLREGQLLVVLTMVRKYPRKTSAELAAKAELGGIPFDRYTFARRLPELEKAGLIQKLNSRKCTIGGREAHTWQAL
jgi:hypothetical protein